MLIKLEKKSNLKEYHTFRADEEQKDSLWRGCTASVADSCYPKLCTNCEERVRYYAHFKSSVSNRRVPPS